MTTPVIDWGFPPDYVKHTGLETAKKWFRDDVPTCIHVPPPNTRSMVLVVDGAVYCRECWPLTAAFTIAADRPCDACLEAPSTQAVLARPVAALLGFRMLLTLCTDCANPGAHE